MLSQLYYSVPFCIDPTDSDFEEQEAVVVFFTLLDYLTMTVKHSRNTRSCLLNSGSNAKKNPGCEMS
jgi:hypothetical protein